MRANPVSEIVESLRTDGAYRTRDDLPHSALDRWLGKRDGWLYTRVACDVLRGYAVACRGRYSQDVWQAQSGRIVRIVEHCGGAVDVEGMAPLLRRSGPVVYAGNHMSMLETLLLPCILLTYGPVSFVVKESLLRYPCFGTILRRTAPISVGRANPRDDFKVVMQQGSAQLAAGRSVVVFPQSTRLTTFDPSRFNSLAVKLARKAGVPIVPLALKTDFLGVGKRFRDFGAIDRSKPVHFRFGALLHVEGTGKETQEAIVQFISDSLRGWGANVLTENDKQNDRES